MRVFFLVTEKEEESWGEVIREGRNEPKGERNLWSSVNEGSRNQRQIKRGKFSTFFCLFIFLKGPCRADIAVLETDHYFFDGGRGVGKFLHANIFLNVSPSSCKHFIFYLHTIYFSVYSLCKQFISKFSNPPVKKIIVRSSRKTCYFKSAILLYSVRPKQHEFCSIHSIP